LKAAAKSLRLTDKADVIGQGSELAEIVLYGVMHHHYKALPVVPKIFYKQNAQDNAKGADSVHIALHDKGGFSVWFGEAKFFNSIEDARLSAVLESVENSLKTEKLKKENSIITSVSDIDQLVSDKAVLEQIKAALSPDNTMDKLKPHLHIPILLLHECSITATSKEADDKYRDATRKQHFERAKSYFEKQVSLMPAKVSKYSEIKFHIILFPVPEKKELVERFSAEVAHQKG
jgi:Cap4 SAVED domain